MFKLSEKTKTVLRVAASLAALLLASPSQAQATRALQAIDFSSREDDRVELTLTLSEPAPDPVVFTIDRPARISLDLPATQVALPERYKKINAGNVRSVASAEAKGRTRVVVELAQLAPYDVRVDGNKIVLSLSSPGSAAAAASPVLSAAAPVGSSMIGGIRNV
ncbi:MAG: AMIN domain-containing protein, partial [Solimonas sp.]